MRILCIWDTAGVFVPIADWLTENGHDVRIIMLRKYDKYGQTANSRYSIMTDSIEDFIMTVIKEVRAFKADVIHANQIHHNIPLIRLLAPLTPIVYQYHGGDVRPRLAKGLGPHSETKLVDKIIVSTSDLQAYGEWFDRPLSSRFFDHGGRIPKTALMIYGSYLIDQRQLARSICEERGLELTIINRLTDEGIPNEEMPAYLSTFEYFLDFKGHIEEVILSKAALEAIACGCKIIHDAALDIEITDASAYIKKNHPSDYSKLYKKVKRTRLTAIRNIPQLIQLMLFRKRGLYFIKMLMVYFLKNRFRT